jgi:hypothetical protein
MGIVGLAALIIILWAFWIDRHRQMKRVSTATT